MAAGVTCSRCEFDPGDLIDGKYRVSRQLGEGSFGQVYHVRPKYGDGEYALKVLKLWCVDPAERRRLTSRFDQEYETGRISHPNLVQSCGKGQVGGNPYILMEYCPGGDLVTAMEQGRVDLAASARDVLAGLEALHQRGKVHRDLKPENVLVKADGTAALTDFGIAGDRNKRLTERGFSGVPKEIFGTCAYMPPEQINPRRGDATVLPTTDIWSFGVMIYQLLTGSLPFGPIRDQADLYAYVTRSRRGDWDRNLLSSGSAKRWTKVIEGCLVPDFHRRLQTASEVALKLPGDAGRQVAREFAASEVPPCRSGWGLRVMQGEEYGKFYKLEATAASAGRKVLTMGRADAGVSNLLPVRELQSCYVSRRHCTFEYWPDRARWVVRDGQWTGSAQGGWGLSTNGTYVGSRPVPAEGVVLELGQIISIGDVKLRVEGY